MEWIRSPFAGTALKITDVPDPVFASGAPGDGVAVLPDPAADRIDVQAPVSGIAVRVMPHAVVIVTETGRSILVHIGINTSRLRGDGFDVHVTQGDEVTAGEPLVSFSQKAITARGCLPHCPVVVLDMRGRTVENKAFGTIAADAPLFALPKQR